MNEDDIRLALAEKILDEMIQAERKGHEDYELFVKHFDKDTLNDFGPTRFKKEMMCIREDLGEYKSREYLGSLKGHVDRIILTSILNASDTIGVEYLKRTKP